MSGIRHAMAAVLLVLIVGATGSSQAQEPLTITTTSLPSTTTGSSVRMTIAVTGGLLPLNWRLSNGKLPPGLKLNSKTGVIAGRPTTPGVYHFEVRVADSGVPAMQIHRDFTLVVTAALSIDWKEPPAVNGQTLEGSVVVTNQTEQDVALTVVVMAVNQIGRATTLGYQKFTLRSGAGQVISFGASPGPGEYIVHADVVAEVARTHTIHRVRKETKEALVIQSPQ
jgi:hypothetical protein